MWFDEIVMTTKFAQSLIEESAEHTEAGCSVGYEGIRLPDRQINFF